MLFLAFMLLCCMNAEAGDVYRFFHLSTTDGLSTDNTRCVIKDRRGYIWIGTEMGLNRYDGMHFTIYSKKELNLESDYIFALQEDASGNIWIGTSRGLTVYDYETDSFSTPKLADGTELDDIVSSFTLSPSGEIWFGGENNPGIYSYDSRNGFLISHPFDIGKPCPKFLSFIDDGRIAIACRGDNLYIYNARKETFSYPDLNDNSDYFQGLHMSGVLGIGETLYVLTFGKGLCAVNIKNKTVESVLPLRQSQRPVRFSYDGSRYLWIGTCEGLVRYDTITSSSIELQKIGSDPFSLSCGYIVGLFCNENWLFAATESGGINIYSPEYDKFNKICSIDGDIPFGDDKTLSMALGENGIVMVSTDRNGLLKYDSQSHALYRSEYRLPSSRVGDICYDRAGALWMSTYGGVVMLDVKTGTSKVYSVNIPKKDPYGVRWCKPYLTSTGKLLIPSTIGLHVFEADHKCFRQLLDGKNFVASGNGNLAEDQDGVLWRSTYASGLFSFKFKDDNIQSAHHYTPENSNIAEMNSFVMVDSKNQVWVTGRGSEILKYDRADSSFVKYNRWRVPSFPETAFISTIEGEDGDIWIATQNGLVRFDPSNESSITYTTGDGLPTNFFQGPSVSLPNGNLLFAINGGLLEFNPLDIPSNAPRTDIISFSIGNERLVTKRNINLVKFIKLPLSSNSFSLTLANPGMVFCGNVSFWLEGLDEAPKFLPSDKIIRYFNVPAGSYILHIDGHEDLCVKIIPPFWSSVPGIVVIVFLSLLVTVAAVVIFMRNKARKERAISKEREMNEKLGFLSGFIAMEQFDINSSDAEFLRKLDRCVTKHLSDDKFSVSELESELGMSHATLNRRMSAVLNTTPNEYIKTKRLAVALHLLKRKGTTPSEVCYRVGFSSPSYFAKCFKEAYGCTPSEVK